MKHILSFAFALFFAASAFGHSQLALTEPAHGAVLSERPEQLKLQFAQPIRLTLLRITGENITISKKGFETSFELDLPELDSGAHDVEWRGLSSDGHPVSGTFSFSLE